ncbi:uracil-DNA glycosylase, partial [Methylocystis sp. 9N]
MQDGLDRRALLALLDWHVESGVDLALDEAPHDRYADSARAPAPPPAAVAARVEARNPLKQEPALPRR